MKHLLVPVDFSEYAYNACLYALRLASAHGAKVTVLHTYHIPIIDPMMPAEFLGSLADTADKDNRERMDKLVVQLKEYATQHHLSVELAAHLTMGFAVDEILSECQKFLCDIIVMGRRLTEGMTKLLVGSVTAAVLEKAKVPVLVVPENVSPENAITDVLYASEFNEEDKRTLNYLIEFSKALKAKVHFVHVTSGEETGSGQKMIELKMQFIAEKNAGLVEFHNVNSEDVTDGLLDYTGSKHISIMAMLTHRRNFFAKLFDRSLTKEVAFKTNIPLMVFHA
ncbi:MAG: universal stress protein [Chitinophagales bacterium]|nr:universal stress protein [Chitinophagales bacterium]